MKPRAHYSDPQGVRAASGADEEAFDVLYLSPEQFCRAPQVGTPCRMTWGELTAYLSRPTTGDPIAFPNPDDAKRQAGAWSPCLYRDNHRAKDKIVRAWAITFDIDGGGDVDRASEAFGAFRKIVHSTYKSRPDAPRCRVVLPLTEACSDVALYERAHAAGRRALRERGFIVDEGAKDASRLNFAPMVHPGQTFGFRATDGVAFDVKKFAAAMPPPPKPKPPPKPEHRDRYVQGALRRASDAVSAAGVGDRHHALAREAYSLARHELGLSLEQIELVLLGAFVSAAGEHRRREGQRTIADAFHAARKAGA
ncbi:MAG: hypothetical protein FWD17_01660 [Polyangiaceae bacterium]|nr:hypothetical protein [Polyangiaceae bacterium]